MRTSDRRRSTTRTAAVAGFAALCLSAGTLASAGGQAAADDTERYLVTVAAGKDNRAVAADAKRSPRASVPAMFNQVLNGFVFEGTPAEAADLQRDPRVARVEPDVEVSVTAAPSRGGEGDGTPWGLDRLDQPALPLDSAYLEPRTGAGSSIYVVDTGVSPHVEFGARLIPGFSTVEDGLGTQDCNGHGTHVAGTAAGATLGVARGAAVVPVRVLDCSGRGSWSDIIAGLDWIASKATGPSVVNISVSGGASDTVDEAVRRLVASGVPVIAAAGNDGGDACNNSPARTDVALTVGASDAADSRAAYSNYGSCLDLYAPGDAVLSAHSSSTSATALMSGTSMAAPHVAGITALMQESLPASTPADLTREVLTAARPSAVSDLAGTARPLAQTSADPTAVIAAACQGTTCTFQASPANIDAVISDYSWAFSDRKSALGPVVTRDFTRAGTVTATVTTSDGARSSSTSTSVACSSTGKGRTAVLTCQVA